VRQSQNLLYTIFRIFILIYRNFNFLFIEKMIKLKQKAIRLTSETQKHLPSLDGLFKPLGDSLYFYVHNQLLGIKKALFYNSETGIARYYEVKYKFAIWRQIVYDSAEVVVDVNFTLWNPSDDMLNSFHETKNYKETFFLQSIVSDLEVTDFDGSKITGVEATSNSYYHQNRNLARLKNFAKINPDKSGTLREDFFYRDGKTAFRSVTINNDNTGSFSKKFRDDTTVNGTFDSVEDDLNGSYTELIDFPPGRYLDKINREAYVWITLPDTIFNALFTEAVYFSAGNIDSSSIGLTVQEEAGQKTTVFEITKKNGAHGVLTIVETEDEVNLDGTWTTWNGYFILIDAEYYFDGSGHVHYEVYASEQSYNNGEEPIIVVDFYFSPDLDGEGTLSYEGETYKITTDESGQGRISKGGKSATFNLYQ